MIEGLNNELSDGLVQNQTLVKLCSKHNALHHSGENGATSDQLICSSEQIAVFIIAVV